MRYLTAMPKPIRESPLKGKIPRTPGMSGRALLFEMLYDKLFRAFVIWMYVLGVTVVHWSQYLLATDPNPWFTSALLLVSSLYLVHVFRSTQTEAHSRMQGIDGEVVVGQLLEGLRPHGYTPIHDVPCVGDGGKPFNIDHVLIGPTGVFVLETKTASKERGRNEQLTYSNGTLRLGDRRNGAEYVQQAKRNAKWLGTLLADRTGRSWPVYPILTFPGWYVTADATEALREAEHVHVLNPKTIGAYLHRNFKKVIPADQVAQIADSLSAYVYKQADAK